MMDFGDKIKQLRTEKDITQADLADAAGIDVTYLSKIENNHMNPPSHDTIVKIADKLGINEDELLLAAGKIPDDVQEKIISSNVGILDMIRDY